MTRPPIDPMALLRGMVLDDRGQLWGELAQNWQLADARAILDTSPEAPKLHFVTRPRGGSKTTDAAAIALVAMLTQLAPGSRCYAAASDAAQSRLVVDAIARLVGRTPKLRSSVELGLDQVKVAHDTHDVTLEALPADGPGAYGLLPSFVVVDELAVWPDTANARLFWDALISAMGKVDGARLLVISSAGDPSGWAAKVRDNAARSKLWRLSETPGPLPWVSQEFLQEQRAALLPSTFRRLHLNQWASPEDRLALSEDLLACKREAGSLEPVRGHRYAVGVDLGLVHDRTAVAICHAEPSQSTFAPADRPWQRVGQRVVVDHVQAWQGSPQHPVDLDEIEAYVGSASRAYNGARLIFDPYQSAGMEQRLGRCGVPVERYAFTSGGAGKLAVSLFLLIRNHALSLPGDDAALLDELASVRLTERSAGVYRMDNPAGTHDDRAVAVALAAEWLLRHREQQTRVIATNWTAAYDRRGSRGLSREEWELASAFRELEQLHPGELARVQAELAPLLRSAITPRRRGR